MQPRCSRGAAETHSSGPCRTCRSCEAVDVSYRSPPRGGSGAPQTQRPSSAHRRQLRHSSLTLSLPLRKNQAHLKTFSPSHACTSRFSCEPSSPLRPSHVIGRHGDGGVGAQLPADPAEAGRAGVRLPGALLGCGSRDESGVGDRRRPVLPVPVGVLLEAGEL
ncbi:hypothetical protein GOODEAATRI_016667 [Goodea atripinnis]|uniref:Uncharacterized protein n=1 Tax=Goodea atripinnis TaxID=208336 RepID=A0ABV0NV48_9TELE